LLKYLENVVSKLLKRKCAYLNGTLWVDFIK
jgi:hypothetical protein